MSLENKIQMDHIQKSIEILHYLVVFDTRLIVYIVKLSIKIFKLHEQLWFNSIVCILESK